MLSIAPIGGAAYYLDLAREDYYALGGEPPGRWAGAGAEKLGLADRSKVSRDHLRAVLEGCSPENPEVSLVQRQEGRQRQPGWDLCFSAPKSVSVLWSQADPQTRAEMQQAHDRAVRDTLAYLDAQVLLTRTGRGGTRQERAAGGVFALFEHGTSRAHDPQLHTHVLVANLCVGADGQTRTIISRELYRHKMAMGALYRAALAEQLGRELGLATFRPTRTEQILGQTVKTPESWFEVRGVSQKAIESFSKRAAEISELAEQYGWSDPRVKAFLAETTRQTKGHVNREESFELWQQQGAAAGFGPPQAARVLQQAQPGQTLSPQRHQQASDAVVARVKERLDNRTDHFPERDIVRAVAEECQGRGLGAADVLRFADVIKAECIKLEGPDPLQPCFATPAMYRLEEELLAAADELRDRTFHRVDGRHVEAAIDEINGRLQQQHGPAARLSNEQLKVLYHVVENPAALSLVQGLAGTGKTSVLAAARIAWEKGGYDVVGLAVSGKAALTLQEETGIASRSLYRTLSLLDRGYVDKAKDAAKRMAKVAAYNYRTSVKYPRLSPLKKKSINPDPPESLSIGKRTIIVADEASMVNARDWRELQQHVADHGAKLVAVGDRNQVQSIGAGGPFSSLLDRHEHATLTTIQRQRHEWMREAVRSLAEGDVDYALSLYAEQGCISVDATKAEAIDSLVRDWAAGRTDSLKQTVVITSTNEEARAVNQKIQTLRGVMGRLTVGGATTSQGETLRIGDRVLFTENRRSMGVFNGDLGKVVNIERPRGVVGAARVHVLLDRKGSLGLFPTRKGPLVPVVPKPLVVAVDLKHYEGLQLGYALTTHKMQGGTVEQAYVLGNSVMQDKEQTYTQLSRVRDSVRMYLTEAEAGEEFTEFLTNASRSREKKMAHDVELTARERFEQEHGEQAERDRRAAEEHRQEHERTRGMHL
ncbi:MAG: hypothetical protein CMJ58_12555 [Planctomycetaceae bacterium]|nr:hypothetical protein [Planctomycetaceae bacterium]